MDEAADRWLDSLDGGAGRDRRSGNRSRHLFGLSQPRTCGLVGVGPKTVRREPYPDNPEVGARMREIAGERCRSTSCRTCSSPAADTRNDRRAKPPPGSVTLGRSPSLAESPSMH